MSKRRKRQLKARKPFQTIHLRKKEKRWSSGTVAKEGHTISEGSYTAARVRGAHFGDQFFKDRLPVEQSPTLQDLFKKVFGEDYPGPDDRIVINKGLWLYFNKTRTEYYFVRVLDGFLDISIKYTSVSSAMMQVNRIPWVECRPMPTIA